jgi:peptide/nickel transport system ATP-binding protein
MPMTPPLLRVADLGLQLPTAQGPAQALHALSFTLQRGETLGLIGESGSGKSLTALALMGLLPDGARCSGSLQLDGRELLGLPERDWCALRGRRLAMVFQEPMTALNPLHTIGRQIAESLRLHRGMDARAARAQALRLLDRVQLPQAAQRLDAHPHQLSGGQRQRVVIAIALALEPALLICVEPTTALDVTTQAQILALIKALQRRRGTAVLFITHDFGVVAQIADQVVVMQTGQVVEHGPASAVLRNPQHAYTRKLIAAIPQGEVRQPAAQPDPQFVLQVQGLNKTYRSGGGLFSKGREVVAAHEVGFELRRGETLGLVGESGSGKSSVGRCLVGLAPFDSGRILFKGRSLLPGAAGRQQAQGRIQMVFQDPYASLNPRHRIGPTIAAGPIAQGLSQAEAHARCMTLLQLVGLGPEAAERFPHEFSGGQRQRIAIARALALQPELLVADEPVSALDVSVQAQVLQLFAQVREQFKLAMVFITHDLRVAGEMCDHIAVMQRGRIVEHGPTARVLADPQHAYTRALIEAVPRLTRAEVHA